MDPDRFFTLCVLIACVLGKTRLSGAGNCFCPKIPEMDLTLHEDGCFGKDSKYRYTCIEGYVRKAGTSNLIKCQEEKGRFNWTVPKLVCIRDPKLPAMDSGSTTQATALLETSTSHQSTRNSTSKANMHQSTSGTGSTTTVQPCTNSSSTHSPMERNNKTISTITAAAQNTIGITVSMVVLLAAVSGVVFSICRRRNRPTSTHQIEIEEMQPMNPV
ncbi:PREDICTED: interleukin-15 receptor subunit alpha isoform X1 [Cyprinodon variegatus]|uniref:Interleukin 15 receptor subunit alpha n=1 Tax=Cyprinodon variegatus TaxID=28743 RepID=A0A3Q2C9T0_CYPVA|nr:PREDICTED: interleukin-15 receptor subunit alpha isoform X1 [Cyprinodon variegatus]